MSTIPCTWEEFKQLAKEFHQAAPTLNLDELDNAWKCLGHAYIGMTDERFWAHSAAAVMRMEMRTFMDCEAALLEKCSPQN